MDDDHFAGSDNFDADEVSEEIEDLKERIDELESDSGGQTLTAGYALGMAIAVTLSWSRNASILWCILHGIFSWGYVIYFALTRH